uniref:Serpin 7 n=1 Tax=Manduca sexta TaxID=7130 RepID=E1B2D5_MANSE|nr:serpin 7 [Manduca sexta]
MRMWTLLIVVGLACGAPNVGNPNNAVNHFSFGLLHNTYQFQESFGTKNVAVAPLSVWSLFSLLTEGSSGQTFSELLNVLGLPNDLRATQNLHLSVKDILKHNSRDVTLIGQSAMFSDCSLEIHPEFCRSANLCSTDVYSVDPSNTTKLAGDINYYICTATEGKIINAVKPQNLDNLRMVLVDALYFKANWTHPFDPTHTKQADFQNSQGRTIGRVNMMYHKAPHRHADVEEIGAQVLEMTYGSDARYSMLLLLPYEGMPIKQLLENLASKPTERKPHWLTTFLSEEEHNVDTYVPRFFMSAQSDLIRPMQYTGIVSIFDPQRAELPGVSTSPLFVSSTVQNVELEVTEEGTVAAAATIAGLEDRILGPRFEANREFVFLILERSAGIVLFAGVYSEPSVV